MTLRFETFKQNFIDEWERMFGGICNCKDIENNVFSCNGTYGPESFLIYRIYHYDGYVPLPKIDKFALKIFPKSMKLFIFSNQGILNDYKIDYLKICRDTEIFNVFKKTMNWQENNTLIENKSEMKPKDLLPDKYGEFGLRKKKVNFMIESEKKNQDNIPNIEPNKREKKKRRREVEKLKEEADDFLSRGIKHEQNKEFHIGREDGEDKPFKKSTILTNIDKFEYKGMVSHNVERVVIYDY